MSFGSLSATAEGRGRQQQTSPRANREMSATERRERFETHALAQSHAGENELHCQVSHVPQLNVGARPIADRPECSTVDLITPQLVVFQAGRFHGAIRSGQSAH